MKAVFIRHNLQSREIVLKLWENRLIGIHFDNIPSTNPDDYKSSEGKLALKRLHGYCATGVVIGATYRSFAPSKILVGEITTGSKIEIRSYPTNDDEPEHIKVVKLKNVQEISYVDHPLLSAIQPRGRTLTGWKSASRYLNAFLEKRPIDASVNSLAPSQLEVICYEYLRAHHILDALLLPIGRSLPDIDIFGIDKNGNKIIAQVTHGKNADEKRGKLFSYRRQNVKLFLFGPKKYKFKDAVIEYIAIEDVFDELWQSDSNSIQHILLETMLPK